MVCWDECGKTEIVQIFVSHEKGKIKLIQFAYAEDGKVRLSQVHGDRDAALNFDILKLDYPSEYLTSFSGHYDEDGFSIQFRTNKRFYRPFGSDEYHDYYDNDHSHRFKYELDKQSFGGFHGAIHNNQVYTMGVYIKPVDSIGRSLKK
ncbi:inactive protein restricted TEV movement 1-like protein [Tanacetum coccineum]|uniref:Inactive protein restricted TEV movement 1-like protein n=1 Tax=Tanacetum coccineum TaxID=301880 RepID=A0ABQ5C0B7_9ASTR